MYNISPADTVTSIAASAPGKRGKERLIASAAIVISTWTHVGVVGMIVFLRMKYKYKSPFSCQPGHKQGLHA